MSQPDALFAELGLAPLWVRRELAGASETAPAEVPAPASLSQATRVERAGAPKAGAAEVLASASPSAAAFVEPEVPSVRRAAPAAPVAAASASTEGEAARRGERVLRPDGTLPSSGVAHALAEPGLVRVDPPDSAGFFGTSGDADDFSGYETESSAFERIDFMPPPSHPVDTPPPISVSELDFGALRERVAGCTACGLCAKRTQTVFGVGDENADWMIVGEAPGENEDRLGEPFVGQAGKLLDNMLRSLGLDRTQRVYIANVIKCRPPGNRNPQPDEVARCEPYLKRQVALVRPKMILALGRFAAQTLLKSDATISSLRGRVHQYEGVPVIVSYHPAYLLRSLPEKSKAWADLCLAQATYLKAAG